MSGNKNTPEAQNEEKAASQTVGLTAEDVRELVQDAAEELAAKHAEALERRMKAVQMDESIENAAALTKAINDKPTIELFKALSVGDKQTAYKAHKVNAAKYLDETTDTEGGFLVDPEFSSEVARIRQSFETFSADCRTVQMSSDTFNLKTIATDPSVFWTNEAAVISGTTMAFGNPKLEVDKLAAILPWTNEFQEDQYVGILSIIQERFAEKIAQAEEIAFTTGSSPFTGILNASGTTTVTMASGSDAFTDITWDDLINMVRSLEEISVAETRNAKFYLSPFTKATLLQLKASGDGNYFNYGMELLNNGTFQGYPVVTVQSYPGSAESAASTKFVTFAKLNSHGYIGRRGGLRVDIYDSGIVADSAGNDVNLITQDSKALRIKERVAYENVLPTGIVHLSTAA